MVDKARVLVVDDEAAQPWVLRRYLAQAGYEVIEAADGHEALSLVSAERPDLALVDVMMPAMDGFELVKLIRRESAMPVILVTARGEEWNRVAGLDIGADDQVVKPFSAPEVVARVRARLRRAFELGGWIEVDSTPGPGSEFRLVLPVRPGTAGGAPAPAGQAHTALPELPHRG